MGHVQLNLIRSYKIGQHSSANQWRFIKMCLCNEFYRIFFIWSSSKWKRLFSKEFHYLCINKVRDSRIHWEIIYDLYIIKTKSESMVNSFPSN